MQDVHDRALFYYRLLQYDVSLAERVVDPPKQAVSVFADTQSSEIKDRIFDEFNSLSILYQKVILCHDSVFFWIDSSCDCWEHFCYQIHNLVDWHVVCFVVGVVIQIPSYYKLMQKPVIQRLKCWLHLYKWLAQPFRNNDKQKHAYYLKILIWQIIYQTWP